MDHPPPLARVAFGTSPSDLRRRKRDLDTGNLRRGAAPWVLLGVVIAGFAGSAVLAGAPGVDSVAELAVVFAPAVALAVLVAWASRPVRTRARRRAAAPDTVCELREEGLRITTDLDAATYAWSEVPAPAWEPNWLVLGLRHAELAIPRDAFPRGHAEEFAQVIDARRGTSGPRAAPPDDAVRFTLDAATLEAASGGRGSRVALVAASLATWVGMMLVAVVLGTVFSGMSRPLAGALLAGGGAMGVAAAVEGIRSRERSFAARSGAMAVWLEDGLVVERGDGWEHRFPAGRVTAVRRAGPLVVIHADDTGCIVAADALAASPALTALVAGAPHRR